MRLLTHRSPASPLHSSEQSTVARNTTCLRGRTRTKRPRAHRAVPTVRLHCRAASCCPAPPSKTQPPLAKCPFPATWPPMPSASGGGYHPSRCRCGRRTPTRTSRQPTLCELAGKSPSRQNCPARGTRTTNGLLSAARLERLRAATRARHCQSCELTNSQHCAGQAGLRANEVTAGVPIGL